MYVKIFYVMGKALAGELSCLCDRSCLKEGVTLSNLLRIKVKLLFFHSAKAGNYFINFSLLTYSYQETRKRVRGKQCRPRSDVT